MSKISERQSSLLQWRGHFIRYSTTKWHTATQVAESVRLTQSFPCRNKIYLWAHPVLKHHLTLGRWKTLTKHIYTIFHMIDLHSVMQHHLNTPGQTVPYLSRYRFHCSHTRTRYLHCHLNKIKKKWRKGTTLTNLDENSSKVRTCGDRNEFLWRTGRWEADAGDGTIDWVECRFQIKETNYESAKRIYLLRFVAVWRFGQRHPDRDENRLDFHASTFRK